MDSTTNPEARRRRRWNQYQRALPQIQALYDELHQRFPQTFFREADKVVPLKKGMHRELSAVYADSPYTARVIRGALNRYARRYAYLQALAAGKPRIDLAGETVDTVTEDEQQMAIVELTTTGKQRGRPRQTDKAKVPAERASLMSSTSGETVTEAQVGTGTDEQEKRQPTTARQKTTSKRRRPLDEVDKAEGQTEEASLVTGKADKSKG